jgi:SAM-dependent methyltransferase
MTANNPLAASFRDPNGFVFESEHKLYRQINQAYRPHYDHLMSSGLYDRLVKERMLIPHTQVDVAAPIPELAYRVIAPETVPFISYPYEWCFDQLKDAALLTLNIQKIALEYGMTLMDASAYNVQFYAGRPTFIDTLSFEIYEEGAPWTAYQQFCKHFLAPLALMSYQDVRLNQLMRIYIDGIPLDLASRLLPGRARWNLGLFSHIYLHANAQKRYADTDVSLKEKTIKVTRSAHLGLLASLESTTRGLLWKAGGSEWANYYDATNYSQAAFEAKSEIVRGYLEQIHSARVLDLGGNTGVFSRLASDRGAYTISADIDPGAVEFDYQQVKQKGDQNLLPLILDLTNPSAGVGWDNHERDAFFQRTQADTVMALALIHHLAIANNLPLNHLARFFGQLGRWLIIEFVPMEDSQVQRLLLNRRNIFDQYTPEGFEAAFTQVFEIREKTLVKDSHRTLYLMEKKF